MISAPTTEDLINRYNLFFAPKQDRLEVQLCSGFQSSRGYMKVY